MNVQTQRDRPDLRPPLAAAVAQPRDDAELPRNPVLACYSVSSYGCVEWFRYPQMPQRRASSDTP